MKKKIAKSQILQAFLQNQEELIESFENRVKVLKADAYNHEQSASQTENRTAGKIEVLKTFEKELAFAEREMEFLKSLNSSTENTRVETGAVVITNQLTFFIGISSEKIEIEDVVIYGISTRAPIYSPMQGLEKGNTFQYNETAYEIEEVY